MCAIASSVKVCAKTAARMRRLTPALKTETARSKEKMTETSVAVAEPPVEEEAPAHIATSAPPAEHRRLFSRL